MTVLEQGGKVQQQQHQGATSTSEPKAAGASKWVIDENELLSSNNYHRAWTFGPMALMTAALAVAGGHVAGPADAAAAAAAGLAAFVLADLGTGVYHWGVDNYGDGKTPVFGRQIAAFQGHHQRPWTITQREFCNNLHQVFKPAAYPAAGILLVSPFLPVWAGFFLPSFLFLVRFSCGGGGGRRRVYPAGSSLWCRFAAAQASTVLPCLTRHPNRRPRLPRPPSPAGVHVPAVPRVEPHEEERAARDSGRAAGGRFG
jgi:hypothetical protein